MQIVSDIEKPELDFWAEKYGEANSLHMKAPPGMENCDDAIAVMTVDVENDVPVIHVAWKPNEIELMHLAQGGKIWISCTGGLPPHSLCVQPPR
jgi:hypothetical protein